MVKTAAEQPLQIYMEWGKYDLRNSHEDWAVAQTNREAIAYLEERGYEPIAVEGSEGSGWSSWLNGTDDLLAALFPLSDD